MMKDNTFIHEDFLLQSKDAIRLFHGFAKELPIIDYHNHLNPKEIASDCQFENLTQLWLNGDHYKWRAMRANGISEYYITGEASDFEKFMKWAETVPYTVRNPLFHWTHLELKRYFGIGQLLSPSNAKSIYEECSEKLTDKSYSSQGLLSKMNVEVVCTTDSPSDHLGYHQAMRNNDSVKVLPTFRPDVFLGIELGGFVYQVEELAKAVGDEIVDYASFILALKSRIDYFHSLGCRLSDHGLPYVYTEKYTIEEIEAIFSNGLKGAKLTELDGNQFRSALLYDLACYYDEKDWTMQLHIGPIRNNSKRLMDVIGADAGCDSIGDKEQAIHLSRFLNRLDNEGQLTKTILYNLNPRDNELFATMAGNFQDGTIPGKIQWGSAWWFLDQKDGMEKQIDTLSNMGLISRFVGMLTDSRSFLSFPRHEYFRRILCNKFGEDMKNGLLPSDLNWIGSIVEGICYYNAKEYFKF